MEHTTKAGSRRCVALSGHDIDLDDSFAGEFLPQQLDGVNLDQHLAVKILETVGQ